MTKIDIFSGFLGAGKTTLIKKLINEAYSGEKLVLIENEFGEIGIDGGFLADAGIEITEMNSGCICCSLVGDFSAALAKVLEEFNPDRVIIEPSGVGKLSDVIRAVRSVETDTARLNTYTAVADAGKCRMYMKNFGEFYNDQIASASAIVLSHTDNIKEHKLLEALTLIREHNPTATIVTTSWDNLSGKDILSAIEGEDTIGAAIEALEEEQHHHGHHHDHGEECHCHGEHHHDHGEECHCHGEHHHDHSEECHCHGEDHHDHGEECHCHGEHHHDHSEECHCHGEHHHDHGEECHCHGEHHHDHSEECSCGCGGHGHHHHADEVFTSVGAETAKRFSRDTIARILDTFSESDDYGMILRAKGIVESDDGSWLHFDYVPGEPDIRIGAPGIIGRLCVIGTGIDEEKIKELFGI